MRHDTISAMDADFSEFPFKRAIGVSTEEIEQASRVLGISFPEDYQEFLRRFGGAIVGPYEVFGLRRAEGMGKTFSVVAVNLEFRKSNIPGTANWLIISADQSGNWVGITPNGKVCMWDHDFGEFVALAESFEGYLRNVCLELPD